MKTRGRTEPLETGLMGALAGLYDAFSPYPFPSTFEVSPLRDAHEFLDQLGSAPLGELSAEALGPYASFAMTTVGTIDDFKHFLPRIAHLAIIGGAGQPGLDPVLIACKLCYAGWANWPQNERSSVLHVFDAAWHILKFTHTDDRDAGDWLVGSAILGVNIIPRLDDVLTVMSASSTLQLANFITVHCASLYEPDGFWQDVLVSSRMEIMDWLRRDTTAVALQKLMGVVEEKDVWQVHRAQKVLLEFQTH